MTAMGRHNIMSERDLEQSAVDICVAIVGSFMPMDFNYNADRVLGSERGFNQNKSIRDTIRFGDDLKNIADIYMQHNIRHQESGEDFREKDRLERIRATGDRKEAASLKFMDDEYIKSLKRR